MTIIVKDDGKLLLRIRENGKIHDHYTEAMVNDGAIVRHVPRSVDYSFLGITEQELELESHWWRYFKSDMMIQNAQVSLNV